MNQLSTDLKMALLTKRVVEEYISVLDTVQPYDRFTFLDSYVPHPLDLVNAIPGVPWEEAMIEISKVIHENRIFIKFRDEYYNIPILEVW